MSGSNIHTFRVWMTKTLLSSCSFQASFARCCPLLLTQSSRRSADESRTRHTRSDFHVCGTSSSSASLSRCCRWRLQMEDCRVEAAVWILRVEDCRVEAAGGVWFGPGEVPPPSPIWPVLSGPRQPNLHLLVFQLHQFEFRVAAPDQPLVAAWTLCSSSFFFLLLWYLLFFGLWWCSFFCASASAVVNPAGESPFPPPGASLWKHLDNRIVEEIVFYSNFRLLLTVFFIQEGERVTIIIFVRF